DATVDQRSPRFDVDSGALFGFLGIVLLAAILLLFVETAGYAAATYHATREAAGMPTTLGESLAYGFRRCVGLAGCTVLVALLALLGVVACVLPAFYVLAATALVGPIYLFERSA